MNPLSKALIGTATAGALAFSAAPAMAQSYERDRGISTGEIIAGALILGGIAAVVSDKGDRYDDRYYNDRRYNDRYDRRYDRNRYDRRRISSRAAVERCVTAAQSDARRSGYRRASVTDIRKVDRKRDGYKIEGRIAVDSGNRYNRNVRYGRGWDNDYRGYRDDVRGYDSGKFKCEIRGNRVTKLDFKDIRGLR